MSKLISDYTVKLSDGTEFVFKYTIGNLIQLESKISTKNLYKLVSDLIITNSPMNLNDLVQFIRYSQPKPLTMEEASDYLPKLIESSEIVKLQVLILNALNASGAFGKPDPNL